MYSGLNIDMKPITNISNKSTIWPPKHDGSKTSQYTMIHVYNLSVVAIVDENTKTKWGCCKLVVIRKVSENVFQLLNDACILSKVNPKYGLESLVFLPPPRAAPPEGKGDAAEGGCFASYV